MDTKPTRYEALKLVIEAYGTQEAAADAFGVSQSSVSRWLSHSKQLPVGHVIQAEADTGISRHWIRPDIYPVDASTPYARFRGHDECADIHFISAEHRQHNGNRAGVLDNVRAAR